MPYFNIEVPIREKLPLQLYAGSFIRIDNPPGQPDCNGYWFHDRTWWTDVRTLQGWSRELIHCLAKDSWTKRIFALTKPEWLCGHAFHLQNDSSKPYILSGASAGFSINDLIKMAQDASRMLFEADVTRDQWGAGDHAQWHAPIKVHLTSGLNAQNFFLQEIIERHGHLEAFIRWKNYADRLHHPAYPIPGPQNASGIGQSEANTILNSRFQNSSATGPATIYLAVFTAAPSDTGLGTEVSGGSYARQAVTCNSTNFPNASAGAITQANAVTWPTATANWGTITDEAYCAASSGGTQPLYWGDLTANQVINNGNTLQNNANSITISFV
jgi:hypothetical protein